MPRLHESIPGLVQALTDRYGLPEPPGSGLGPFEALVATVLDRLTEPKKALAARNALREDGLLHPQALAESDPAEASESLRSAGVSIPEKSLAPLRRLARWLVDRYPGSIDDLADTEDVSTTRLREELLELNGVGPATADAILLLAFHRPSYPVDRPTYRILLRHGWLDPSSDYDEARGVVEGGFPDDPESLARLSVWFERLGRDHCRATVAKCERCPLAAFLPEGGPVDPS